MRLLITIAIVSLAVVACSARPAEDDYAEYDDAPAEPAPTPSTKAPGRHSLPNSRTARGPSPLIGSRGVKTTAAPPKPAEPEVVNEPEVVEGEEGEEALSPATTTEAPKKGLSRGVVRPFRSNQDLLAALKRKRQQEHWRVVYQYLYVKFGYPVNLYLNLSLDPEGEGDSEARSEINEVTTGDSDRRPKLKSDPNKTTAVPPTIIVPLNGTNTRNATVSNPNTGPNNATPIPLVIVEIFNRTQSTLSNFKYDQIKATTESTTVIPTIVQIVNGRETRNATFSVSYS